MTDYLQQYIEKYAAITKPLREQKTLLDRKLRTPALLGPKGGNTRKRLANQARITTPTPRELDIYRHLQRLFSRPSILTHFQLKRQLYIDLDALKEWGIGAHVYHCRDDTVTASKQKSMKSILFRSRLLADAETRYWPTELKVAGLV